MIGTQVGPYQIVAKVGEGGPPPRANEQVARSGVIAPKPSERMRS